MIEIQVIIILKEKCALKLFGVEVFGERVGVRESGIVAIDLSQVAMGISGYWEDSVFEECIGGMEDVVAVSWLEIGSAGSVAERIAGADG